LNIGCSRRAKTCGTRVAPFHLRKAAARRRLEEDHMGTILIVVLVLLLVGAIPSWPHSRSWGYFPSGFLGLALLVLLILVLTGRV
jgi:hypothetical protein